jgi:hypothetical protein
MTTRASFLDCVVTAERYARRVSESRTETGPPNSSRVVAWVKEIKRTSSLWAKEARQGCHAFQWQAGYGAFSVSQSQSAAVERYIGRQPEHHRRLSFQEVLRTLLSRHKIAYDERSVWD